MAQNKHQLNSRVTLTTTRRAKRAAHANQFERIRVTPAIALALAVTHSLLKGLRRNRHSKTPPAAAADAGGVESASRLLTTSERRRRRVRVRPWANCLARSFVRSLPQQVALGALGEPLARNSRGQSDIRRRLERFWSSSSANERTNKLEADRHGDSSPGASMK